jgi:hypothetical protein
MLQNSEIGFLYLKDWKAIRLSVVKSLRMENAEAAYTTMYAFGSLAIMRLTPLRPKTLRL